MGYVVLGYSLQSKESKHYLFVVTREERLGDNSDGDRYDKTIGAIVIGDAFDMNFLVLLDES